jgi:LacI family transcriptional regulator
MSDDEPRTTIAEIARQANVSVPTVSKVLNGRGGVSDATRDRVRALLDAAGYERRGGLRRQPIGLIDFVMRDLSSSWASEMVLGAEGECARAGIGLVVTATHGRRVGNRVWFHHIVSRRTDGVVLVVSDLKPGAVEELRRLNVPIVLVDPVGSADPSLPTVAAANWSGGLQATEHLVSRGHTRIGIITGPEDVVCSQDRLDGYRSALGRAGIGVDERLVRYGDFQVEGGRRGAAELLDLDDPPTAIFAGADQQAAGVYDEARRRGLRIPEDLSVVGFDDIELGRWLSPALTTVRQPLAEMAAIATRMVLDLGRSGATGPQRMELATSFVERDSTAPPRGA